MAGNKCDTLHAHVARMPRTRNARPYVGGGSCNGQRALARLRTRGCGRVLFHFVFLFLFLSSRRPRSRASLRLTTRATACVKPELGGQPAPLREADAEARVEVGPCAPAGRSLRGRGPVLPIFSFQVAPRRSHRIPLWVASWYMLRGSGFGIGSVWSQPPPCNTRCSTCDATHAAMCMCMWNGAGARCTLHGAR